MRSRTCALFLVLAAAWAPCRAGQALPKHYLAAKDVKRGMKGYGLSVFRGTKPERFGVEVLGVLRNRMPKQDMILIRMKGAGLEKTGVIAGMSGSPIYLKVGNEYKLAGAVAYGWSFPKEPVCGVTPIENMYSVITSKIGERKVAAGGGASGKLDEPILLGQRKITDVRVASAPPSWEGLAANAAVLYRLRTPLYISGLAEPAMTMAREMFEPLGFLPVQGGGAGAEEGQEDVKLEPGSAVAITLADGDITMSGGGTVTDVIGNTVLAFGHPMFGEGRVSVPISTASVQLSFASLVRSFKMITPIKLVGRLTADAQAGVVGKLGEPPRMIPVVVKLRRSDIPGEETFRCRVFDHPRMTSRIIAMFLANAVVLRGGFPPENTVSFRATVEIKGYKPLVYENVYSGLSGGSAISKAFGEIVKPIGMLMSNPLGKAQIERVTAEFHVRGQGSAAGIASVRLERNVYRPGDTLRAIATLKPYKGEPVLQSVELKLPDDLPPGSHSVTVCDAQTSYTKDRANAPHRFQARTLDQLVEGLRHQIRRRRLFIRMKLPDRGIARKGIELPSLPPSMFNVIASQKVTGLTTTGKSLVAHVDTPFVVKGNHVLRVLIRPRELD